ncbi:MAG: TonB-dependent receptor [Saprospiraceae bacterium]|nr:TonB-dependent receptor [Saprospiraceae bacterium]
MGKIILAFILTIVSIDNLSAQFLMGNVVDEKNQTLVGVSVYWLESNKGTITNENGYFKLDRKETDQHLVLSYTGFQKDTINVSNELSFEVFKLREGVLLSGVEVNSERSSNSFSRLNPLNIETLEKKEFRKAACCSLSESFQTSNAVDVSYTNAVTGSKEIQFLGLRGIYTQLLIENRPAYSGIISNFGYDLLSGTWLDRVDILKGASSVQTGVQSMSGAINVQLKKPYEDHPLYFNLFADAHGRYEANLHLNKQWNHARSSGIYLNGNLQNTKRDHNHDGFQDEPQNDRINGLIRNIFFSETVEGQVNAQALYEKKTSGQLIENNPYLIQQELSYFNLFGNVGYVGFSDPNDNTGSIYDIAYTKIKSLYGNRSFEATEKNIHLKLLYNHTFSSGNHQIMAGPQFKWHDASELFDGKSLEYKYKIVALFAEHSFRSSLGPDNKITTTLGLHADFIENSKPIWMPRASLRYLFAEDWTMRASIGRGYRLPRIFSENTHLMASSKNWVINGAPSIEKSWNTGINIVGKPFVGSKELEINMDAYYTWFNQQLIVDLDKNYNEVNIYALDGKSNAFQSILTLSYRFFSFMNLKAGGKFTQTDVQFDSGYRSALLTPKYRALLSMDLETSDKKWLWNITSNYVGKMRLSDKEGVPADLLHGHHSPTEDYVLLQSQLTFTSGPWEFYAGSENLLAYNQHDAIIQADNPYGNFFNASEVYAPISGRKAYVGIKWKITGKK